MKFHQSWRLFKASIRVTLQHRKLLWFPFLTTIATAFIALFFLSAIALPVVFHHTGYALTQREHWMALKDYYFSAHTSSPAVSVGAPSSLDSNFRLDFGLPWFVLLAIYLVSMFLATFFNVAFYSEIIAAFNGKGVSFRRGLLTARNRLPSILAWSLLAGAVGWVIRIIEERLPMGGRIVAGLIGVGWSVAAVFAIPVIIQEQPTRNPFHILRQSAFTLKRTWGEGLIGYVGFSAGALVIFAASLLPLLFMLVPAIVFKSILLGILAVAIWFLILLTMSYVSSVAEHVFRCALYLYASEGVVPESYSPEMLDTAWKVKRNPEK